MRRLIFFIGLMICCVTQSHATVIEVTNILDSGAGSLRQAILDASSSDTVLINVKGEIVLNSQIDINGFTSLTIIGPYAKHNSITPSDGWSGSLFSLTSSGNVTIKGLGFNGGNDDTRHVSIENCSDEIIFNRCLFEGSSITSGNGGSVLVISSLATFTQCSFIDNSAAVGGAFRAQGNSVITLTNCTFSENFASTTAGAVSLAGSTEAFVRYCTFVGNYSDGAIQAFRSNGSVDVEIENLAIGNNGSGRQIQLVGSVVNDGGNRIRLNDLAEATYAAFDLTDLKTSTLVMGLRTEILEDGYGLKYWPIVNPLSNLINSGILAGTTPDYDCRNAPRALIGSGLLALPDAGACEYTHLRVRNDAGSAGTDSSFLWAISDGQRKDLVHYIEFDIDSPSDILFDDEGDVSGAAYIIDGFSQPNSIIPGPHEIGTPGVTRGLLIIDFVNGGSHGHGIRFQSGSENSILQGVSVQDFNNHAVETNVIDVSFFGNEIGLDDDGNENGTTNAGLRINAGNSTIGGWEHWQRNVVSGNGRTGSERMNVRLNDGSNHIVQGNIIGGAPDGVSVTGASSTRFGIYTNTQYNIIGGGLINAGNIIVDNDNGIYLDAFGDYAKIQGNKIGIGWDGLTALGNDDEGIQIVAGDNNLIGGYSPEFGNIIAHNAAGVTIENGGTAAINNRVLGNSIHSNAQQGIDLGNDDDILENDGGVDGTANTGLDHPELITSENCGLGETKTSYQLSVPETEDYRVEFFSNSSPDLENGEGEVFIGTQTVTVTTNPETFTFDHGIAITPGTSISATVTRISTENTSEFGTNVTVTAPLDPSFTYADICAGESAFPLITGATGGTFRFSGPEPADGETLDAVTGELVGGMVGETYDIIYGFDDLCETEDTVSFTVNEALPGFTFADFCPGDIGMPAAIESPGGTFSLNPDLGDGATITADSGLLSGGIEGTTYTVKYVVTDGVCTDSSEVNVMVTLTDESFTMADFCPLVTSPPASPAELGGVFSFVSPPGDGATISASDGAITGGIEGTTYMVKYVVGPCAEEFVLAVTAIETLEDLTFNDFCPDFNGVPTSFAPPGGTFSLEFDLGASIDAATGEISNTTEGTTYNVIYTVGTCAEQATAFPTVIAVDESFTFENFCVIDDSSGTGGLAALPDSSSFSLFDAPIDVTINAETGIIYDPVEGDTYSVVNTTTFMGCTQSDTILVLALGVDESFTMADFCPLVTSPPASPAELGGTFSFASPPGDGATINSGDGAITGGIEGTTYMVKYVVGICSEEFILPVTAIETLEDLTFNDFCPDFNGVPTSFAPPGGTFSLEFDLGASIDAATGEISNATEGITYNVIYTVGTCAEQDTAFPTVIAVDESFTFENFCVIVDSSGNGGFPALPDSSTFYLLDPPDDVTINDQTGIIYNPEEGDSYTVINTTTVLGCTQEDTLLVTAINVDASFDFDDICFGDNGSPYNVIEPGGQYFFAPDPDDAASLDMDSGLLQDGVGGWTYMVRYIANVGACFDSTDVEVAIVNPNATFIFPDFCPGVDSPEPIDFVDDGIYSFQFPALYGETIDELTGVISGALEDSTYFVIHTYSLAGCEDVDTQEVDVLVVHEEVAYEDFCWEGGSGDPDVVVSGEFTFGTPAPEDDAEVGFTSGLITGATEGATYEIVHTVTEGICTQSDSTTVIALGVDESFTFADFCPGAPSAAPEPMTPDGVYEILSPLGDGATINTTTGVITNGQEGTTYEVMYSVFDATGLCNESSTQMVTVISADESFSFDDFCAEFGGTPYDIGDETGTFEIVDAPEPDATIDEITGTISGASGGFTYPVVYTVGTCDEQDTVWVTAFESEDASFTIADHCANIETAAEISGTPGGSFYFSPSPADDAVIDISTGIITNATGGTYTVKYLTSGTAETCADTTYYTFTIYALPEITNLNSTLDVYCPYDELGPIDVVEHLIASQVYWYKTNTGGDILDSTFNYTPDDLDYGNNVFYAQPKSAEGCYGDFESYTLFLSDTAGMNSINDFSICLGSPAQLEAYGGVAYEWHTEVPLADYNSAIQTAFSLNEEVYAVTIQNEYDCIVEDTTRVSFLPANECQITVFNAFSPNGDGTNDFWYIDNLINYIPNTVYIYNRWGDEVQKIPNYDNINAYWDGTDSNGNELPPNTYFFVVVTEDPTQNQASWVQLVR